MKTWWLILGVTLSACGSGDGKCGEIYDKMRKCSEEEKDKDLEDIPSKGEFVAMCKAATGSRKESIDDLASCIKEDSCEAIDKCVDEKGEARYNQKRIKDLEEQIAGGKWADAFKECQYAADSMSKDEKLKTTCEKVFTEGIPKLEGKDAEEVASTCRYTDELKKVSPAFAKVCVDVDAKELAAKKTAALAARDAASDDYSACFDLQSVAERVGEPAKKEAEQICAEINAARTAKQALTEAAANVSAQKAEMPYYCNAAAEELSKIQPRSEWTTAKLDEVTKGCYLELGKVIVAGELHNMSDGWCPFQISDVRKGIKAYALAGKDPALDAELAKTDKACASSDSP